MIVQHGWVWTDLGPTIASLDISVAYETVV